MKEEGVGRAEIKCSREVGARGETGVALTTVNPAPTELLLVFPVTRIQGREVTLDAEGTIHRWIFGLGEKGKGSRGETGVSGDK